jgi:spore coat protein E
VAYREIVTKAVIAKGKKKYKNSYQITVDNEPTTVLGVWIINHNFKATDTGDKIKIDGSFDANVWYSYDNDTKTEVVKKACNYSEIIKMNDISEEYDNANIVVRSLTDPKCVSANIDSNKINYEVELELGIELVGDVKVKISVLDELDGYDLIEEKKDLESEIEDSVNTDYLKEK